MIAPTGPVAASVSSFSDCRWGVVHVVQSGPLPRVSGAYSTALQGGLPAPQSVGLGCKLRRALVRTWTLAT
jgi:hypothetical protein